MTKASCKRSSAAHCQQQQRASVCCWCRVAAAACKEPSRSWTGLPLASLMGLAAWTDSRMQRVGISAKKRRITIHYMVLLGEQLAAMLPLSLLQVTQSCPSSAVGIQC